MNGTNGPPGGLLRLALARYAMGVVVLALFLFLPAGTLAYWQAWAYLATLFVPMFLVLVYLLRRDPDLLRRRLTMREREARQTAINRLAVVFFVLLYVLPGLDRRFGWSHVPAGLAIAGDVLFLLAYTLFFLVLRENSYAARTVRVEEGQTVVRTGPYALVRHPMYLAFSLMLVVTPLALGSAWGVIAGLGIVPILVTRVRAEEVTLRAELPGYADYAQATRYRLFPGIW